MYEYIAQTIKKATFIFALKFIACTIQQMHAADSFEMKNEYNMLFNIEKLK